MPALHRLRSLLGAPRAAPRAPGERPHVCQIVDRLALDGVGSRVTAVSNGLDPRRFMASCISLGPRQWLALEGLAPRVEAFGLLEDDSPLRQVLGILSRYRVDVVHTHGPRAAALGPEIARRLGRPLVHTGYGAGERPHVGSVLLASSEAVARQMARDLGLPGQRIATVPTGVDAERFRPPDDRAALRQALDLPADGLVLGTVGEGAALVEVAAGLGARALVVGGGGSENGRAGIALSPTRDVARVLGAMDIYVAERAGLRPPVALLEAMACGLAVVAVDAPGISRVVSHGETGLVVSGVEEIGPAVAELRDGERRLALGRAARWLVERRFSARAMVEAHEKVYGELAPG